MNINERNAAALHEALKAERMRGDEQAKQIAGLQAAFASLRSEMETLRKLVLVQRTGTGPSVLSQKDDT